LVCCTVVEQYIFDGFFFLTADYFQGFACLDCCGQAGGGDLRFDSTINNGSSLTGASEPPRKLAQMRCV
jgi:hypothetical protein